MDICTVFRHLEVQVTNQKKQLGGIAEEDVYQGEEAAMEAKRQCHLVLMQT